MRVKATLGIVALVIGIAMTSIGYGKRLSLSADTVSDGTIQTVSITLFLGIALIILSAILFITASGKSKS